MVYTILAVALVALFYGYVTLTAFLGYNLAVEIKAKNLGGSLVLGGLTLVSLTVLTALVYTFYA